MTIYTHTIQVSEQTFQRLFIQAQAKQTTVNELAERALNRALPPSIAHVPERWRADLQQMQLMSDEVQLIRVTAELPADLQLRLKMHCLNTRQTMSQYLRSLLDESLPR